MLKQSKWFNLLKTSFWCLHTEAASSCLRENVNYINKSVYLPKMAPLKWGCRGVWVLAVCGGITATLRVKGRPHTWDNTNQMNHSTHCPNNHIQHIQYLAPITSGSSPYPPPLVSVQESLLVSGPNFARVPKYPRESYIAAVEEACNKPLPGRQKISGQNPVSY